MISKAKLKLIHSLENKKGRRESSLFVAEGPKVVGDLLSRFPLKLIVAVDEWIQTNRHDLGDAEVIAVTDDELRKASLLQHPQQVLALFELPQEKAETEDALSSVLSDDNRKLSLALDSVQDPGNLGTIIRIADWFGIEDIFCSQTTVDAYSPKVIQATMGSIARVRVHYTDLAQLIHSLPSDYPVYGTLLDGEDIYSQELTQGGLIVMGNEGNGISPAIRPLINHRLLIPNYPKGRATADSLNVAIATAITCAEFRRHT
ncbi:MAG: RNA methyltransferase [Prevotella sp.]